jgi:hypothetical protein
MDRVAQIAGTGLAASTGTMLVQQEKRIALLDIDVFQGLLSFDVPLGNLVVILGFCFSAYAFWRARQHAKEQRRREGDPKWIDSIVKKPK